jgi:hypothetical protein
MEIVKAQQCQFDGLWSKAMPADQRIIDIKKGVGGVNALIRIPSTFLNLFHRRKSTIDMDTLAKEEGQLAKGS